MSFSNANILSVDTSSTNIGTSSYVQLSESIPIGTTNVIVSNSTTSNLILGYGSAGSEIGLLLLPPSSSYQVQLGSTALLPAGIRVALIAVDTTASSGYVAVALLP